MCICQLCYIELNVVCYSCLYDPRYRLCCFHFALYELAWERAKEKVFTQNLLVLDRCGFYRRNNR